jgi:hypothetical protein
MPPRRCAAPISVGASVPVSAPEATRPRSRPASRRNGCVAGNAPAPGTNVPATGGFSRHAEAIQAELLDGLGAAADAAGGTFTMSYTTVAAARVP